MEKEKNVVKEERREKNQKMTVGVVFKNTGV